MRARALWLLGALAVAGVSVAMAFSSGVGIDYPSDASRPMRALLAGDVGRFFDEQALMGSFSLLLRLPFAALAHLWDGSELLVYRFGAVPCVAAPGLLGLYLVRLMGERGQPWPARALVGGICLLNPLTAKALLWGHPEDLLAAALCVGAALAALRNRPAAAGVLLGLALVTKQWAVLAVLPVLLAASDRRVRLALVAGALAAALTLPMVIGHAGSFQKRNVSVARADGLATPPNAWWPLAEADPRRVFDGVEDRIVTEYELSPSLSLIPHPLIVVLALPLSYLFWRRRSALRAEDVLGLLALLFLLRCVLDPWNMGYYHLPFLFSLAAWEGLTRRGLPLMTLLSATALWLIFDEVAPAGSPAAWNAAYLAWSVPFAALIAAQLYAPGLLRRVGERLGASRPVGVPAPGARS